ncbi:nuclear transport factor 2 family protein [Nocardia uniformis]|uniref:Nuclear transport factor 2 family protein n=1 Tax=Nocardia uniformis TaxID=53432 RepID=A0A849C9X8_9NOCA|nr:nuclear transport factor 2 family protein [Nocardia uniformis]NNH72727.1 nuclear transport factor 2 family protein [Nocardia uniformis]
MTELDPVVAQFVNAVNAGDREAFEAVLTADATMSDDGNDLDLRKWAASEIFDTEGRMDIQSISDGGRAVVADYTNTRWGSMRTAWRFTVEGEKISRFETGQA